MIQYLFTKKNIPDETELTKLLSTYHVNIVAKSSGIKPKTFGVNFENTSIQSV